MNKQQAWDKFCELQYQYYYWDKPCGKDIGIHGTSKRKKNVKRLVNLLKQSKTIWIDRVNKIGNNEAHDRLANILGFNFTHTYDDFLVIWDFILNQDMKNFDKMYDNLYQARNHSKI